MSDEFSVKAIHRCGIDLLYEVVYWLIFCRDDVKVKISCNTEIKVQTVLFPFSPTEKLSISVVGVNEIEVFSEDFPELFRRVLLLRKSPFRLRRRQRQPLSRWQTKKWSYFENLLRILLPNGSEFILAESKKEEPASAGNPPEFLPYCNSARIVV